MNFQTRTTFDTVMRLAVKAVAIVSRRYIIANGDDGRLLFLSGLLAHIASDTFDLDSFAVARETKASEQVAANLKFELTNLVAFCLLWLTPGHKDYSQGISVIAGERGRQKELFRDRKIAFDCASPVPDPQRKFRVLFEEAGEVAHAIDQVENHGLAASNIKTEVSHVAAVAVAWLESLEETRSADCGVRNNGGVNAIKL